MDQLWSKHRLVNRDVATHFKKMGFAIINLLIIISKEYQNRNYLASKNIFFVHLNKKGERREPIRIGANFSKKINILHWEQNFSYFCLDYHYL